MISAFFKILSVAILLTGLLAIMVIKNISAEKQKYINELELTLREEQKINELYKIEWDHLVSLSLHQLQQNFFDLRQFL